MADAADMIDIGLEGRRALVRGDRREIPPHELAIVHAAKALLGGLQGFVDTGEPLAAPIMRHLGPHAAALATALADAGYGFTFRGRPS